MLLCGPKFCNKDLVFLVLCYSIEKQVKDMVHRAFWDAFQEKISEDPPDFRQAVVLIQEVKEVGITFYSTLPMSLVW